MHENEIIVLTIGCAVSVFIYLFRHHLQKLPAFWLLICAFAATLIGWVATLLEHFFLPVSLNLVEHLGYMINGLLLLAWACFGIRKGKVNRND